MQIGIIGFKNTGKSSLFDVLIGHAPAGHERPGESRHGIVTVPDDRLDFLAKVCKSKKKVHSSFDILDLPPLQIIKNSAETGSAHILEEAKNCEALIHVVRQFTNPAVPYERVNIDPVTEKRTLETELILVDLGIVENRLNRIETMKHKSRDFVQKGEPELLERCRETLEQEEPLRTMALNKESEKLLRGYQFLTLKPRITIINIDEDEIPNRAAWIERFENQFASQSGMFEAVCCRAERELMDIPEEERDEFRKELGMENPAARLVIEKLMNAMHLIRFLTAGTPAAQSWIIPAGSTALKAAGVIHSDIERGFIRAEIVAYDDYRRLGSVAKCRNEGCFKVEGRDGIINDGDVVLIRFNV